jgi:hypothetical protein
MEVECRVCEHFGRDEDKAARERTLDEATVGVFVAYDGEARVPQSPDDALLREKSVRVSPMAHVRAPLAEARWSARVRASLLDHKPL